MEGRIKETEALIRKRLGGRYNLERLDLMSKGSVRAIFEALGRKRTIHAFFKDFSRKKGISIPEIYRRAGKQLDMSKVRTQDRYVPFLVSKEVVGIKEFFFEPKIGFLFIPQNADVTKAEIQTFAFKGYEQDFKKIWELLPTLRFASLEMDLEKNPVAATDNIYENIRDKLTFWGYTVKSIDMNRIRNILTALREAEKLKGTPSKVPRYTHYYSALLVSKKVSGGLLFSKEERICLLLAPRALDTEELSIDIIECGGSEKDILKIKMMCKMAGQRGKINFMKLPGLKNPKLLV